MKRTGVWVGLCSFFYFYLVSVSWGAIVDPLVEGEPHSPRVEFWTGSLGGFSFGTITGTDFTNLNILGMGLSSGSVTGILPPTLGYVLESHLEVVLSFGLSSVNRKNLPSNTIISSLKILAGLAFNFSNVFEKSIYWMAQGGILSLGYNDANQAYFAISTQIGKRFSLFESITYSPSIGFEWVATSPSSTMSLNFVPAQLSVYF